MDGGPFLTAYKLIADTPDKYNAMALTCAWGRGLFAFPISAS